MAPLPLILASALLVSGGPADDKPIRLIAETTETGIRVQVVGASPRQVHASYKLEVESGSGNRSVQRGRAIVQPGPPATYVNLLLGKPDSRDWTARLTVEGTGLLAYEEVAGSGL